MTLLSRHLLSYFNCSNNLNDIFLITVLIDIGVTINCYDILENVNFMIETSEKMCSNPYKS